MLEGYGRRILCDVSILTPAEAGVQPFREQPLPTPSRSFNPHPRRGGGATQGCLPCVTRLAFQSSPPPRRGCNSLNGIKIGLLRVSILTPAEAGVQHHGR